jgi:hypothetical protein
MKKILNLEKKQIFNIMVILSILLFAIAIAPKTLQNDTFYTIKIGEYIMQNGIFDLTQDTFSWHELPYTYPHWLYDLVIYLIYNSFDQVRYIYINYNIYRNFGLDYLFVK